MADESIQAFPTVSSDVTEEEQNLSLKEKINLVDSEIRKLYEFCVKAGYTQPQIEQCAQPLLAVQSKEKHNSFTHSGSHKTLLHTTPSHIAFHARLFHTQHCHTHSLSLSRTHITLSHTALSHTVLSHNLSSAISFLSLSNFHTCFELVGRS